MIRIFCLLIGYAFGLFQTAYIYGRMNGIDIRSQGSGNAGTTNALRTLGLKAGLITLGCDIGKCILAVLVTWLLFHRSHAELIPLIKIWTSAGVILGHDFPFYLNFKGGKGIAATGGMIIAFGDLPLTLIGLVLFLAVFLTTHYVSLASLCLSVSFFAGVIIRGNLGYYGMAAAGRTELYCVTAVLTVLAFYGHRGNIVRLLKGCERKTYLSRGKHQSS
ncbi:MAG: glycerol-3-phosphate 1-O-acyltransferase PlsY [Eubacterium sp.]|nr:glycerol-3-phosphate 1-O-acyltransferase PlsY [Eubacterium sp.]